MFPLGCGLENRKKVLLLHDTPIIIIIIIIIFPRNRTGIGSLAFAVLSAWQATIAGCVRNLWTQPLIATCNRFSRVIHIKAGPERYALRGFGVFGELVKSPCRDRDRASREPTRNLGATINVEIRGKFENDCVSRPRTQRMGSQSLNWATLGRGF